MNERGWERTEEKRIQTQKSKMRASMIGCYAPLEPFVMSGVLKFLKVEKKLPLALVHKIADRLAGITVSTTVVTHDEIIDFIKKIPDDFGIARGPCACRLHTADTLGPDARDLSAGKLELCRRTPLNVDIQIATCARKFGGLDTYTMISKEELLELERECYNMGLVANIYMMMGGEAGICHCSSATCVPFLANEAIGGESAVIKKGAFLAVTNQESCEGVGDCVKVCHFGARGIVEVKGRRISVVDPNRCYGCGLCMGVCPENAISLTPRRN